MSDQEPKTKDGFSKHVKHRVGDNLRVHINLAGAVGDAPDAVVVQCLSTELERNDVHWVQSPQNQSESTNGSEESSRLGVLRLDH